MSDKTTICDTTFKSITQTTPEGHAELGVMERDGVLHSALGSFVSKLQAIGYLSSDLKSIDTWDGKHLGTAHVICRWHTRSWISKYMYQVEAVICGRRYTGRTMGAGMLWRGKLKKMKQ